jgi:hypothetical protein
MMGRCSRQGRVASGRSGSVKETGWLESEITDDRGLFWEGLVGAGRESERGPAYSRYLRTVADNPDFVGAHWFQYIDKPLTGRALDGENAHVGFVTVADLPYAGRGTRRQPVGVARATAYCGPRRTITWQWRVGSSRRMLERRTSGPPDIESARL